MKEGQKVICKSSRDEYGVEIDGLTVGKLYTVKYTDTSVHPPTDVVLEEIPLQLNSKNFEDYEENSDLETRVYCLLPIDSWFKERVDKITDEEWITESEKQGGVYTLQGFQIAFNTRNNIYNHFIRVISTQQNSKELGLLKIELNHTKTLLASCEKALENRGKQIENTPSKGVILKLLEYVKRNFLN
jgi:hypothetical protein